MKKLVKVSMVGVFVSLFTFMIWSPALAEVGVTDTKIKVGSHTALTGPVAFAGKFLNEGMRVYYQAINDAGGIHGRKVEYIAEDNAYKPARAVAATKKLLDRDQVFIMQGVLGAPMFKAIEPILTENKVPFLFPMAAITDIVHPVKRYVFSYTAIYDRIFTVQVDTAVKQLKAKKISLFYPDNAVGQDFRAIVIKRLKKYGLTPLESVPVKHTDVDFSGVVAKLKASGTDTVMNANHIPVTVAFLKECRRQNFNPTFFQDPSATDPLIFGLAKDPAVTNGIMGATYVWPNDSDAEPVKKWRATMKKYSTMKLSNYTQMAYAQCVMTVDAMKQVGRNLTRERLIDQLETWQGYNNGLSGPINFSPTDHEGQESFFIVRANNNKWEFAFDKRISVEEKLVRD
ncbi:ABC transporter substrate-binding protein [Thermodesulfobacteriota bacterium]